MSIDEEMGVQNRISKLVDITCFGVFSAVLGVTNDDFCPRTIAMYLNLTPDSKKKSSTPAFWYPRCSMIEKEKEKRTFIY